MNEDWNTCCSSTKLWSSCGVNSRVVELSPCHGSSDLPLFSTMSKERMQTLAQQLHEEEEPVWSAQDTHPAVVKEKAVYRASRILPIDAILLSLLLEKPNPQGEHVRHSVALCNMFARSLALPSGAVQSLLAVEVGRGLRYRFLFPTQKTLVHRIVPWSLQQMDYALIGASPWTVLTDEDTASHVNAWAAFNAVAPDAAAMPSCFASAIVMNNYDLLVHGAAQLGGSATRWFEGRNNVLPLTTDVRCLKCVVDRSPGRLDVGQTDDEYFAEKASFDVLRFYHEHIAPIDFTRASLWDWVIAASQYNVDGDGVKRLQLILRPILDPQRSEDHSIVFPESDFYHTSPIALAVAAGCFDNARFLCNALYRDNVRGFRSNHPEGLLSDVSAVDIQGRNVPCLKQLMLSETDWWTFPREILHRCALHRAASTRGEDALLQLLCDLPDLLPDKFARELPGVTKQGYIDRPNGFGSTALWAAVTAKQKSSVRILILAGADPYLKMGSQRQSCFDVASASVQNGIKQAMKERSKNE